MTMLQIKTRLKRRIDKTDNVDLLMAIDTILEVRSKNEVPYQLTATQQESIRISKEQFKKGQFKSHREVINDTRKWLKRK